MVFDIDTIILLLEKIFGEKIEHKIEQSHEQIISQLFLKQGHAEVLDYLKKLRDGKVSNVKEIMGGN